MTYWADGHELRGPYGRLLLGGPVLEIAAFAAWLNAHPPVGERALRAALVDLIEGTADCAFAPFVPLTDEVADELAQASRDVATREYRSDIRFAQLDLFGGCR